MNSGVSEIVSVCGVTAGGEPSSLARSAEALARRRCGWRWRAARGSGEVKRERLRGRFAVDELEDHIARAAVAYGGHRELGRFSGGRKRGGQIGVAAIQPEELLHGIVERGENLRGIKVDEVGRPLRMAASRKQRGVGCEVYDVAVALEAGQVYALS